MSSVKSIVIAGALAIVSAYPHSSAEDLKVLQLEHDVRDLQGKVQQQSRRIDMLEAQLSQMQSGSYAANLSHSRLGNAKPAGADAANVWLNIANWDRVHTGTTELDVIAALGPPTAVRKSDTGLRQTLLYSIEIAAGGFLSGQVVLDDHRVVEVQKPALK